MTEQELRILFNELSEEEKLGQLLQLNARYFGVDGLLTGEATQWAFSADEVDHAGSVLNIFGRERLRQLQQEHLKRNRTPMLFMADVVFGYRITLPISLCQAGTFDTELVRRLASNAAQEAAFDGIRVTFSPMTDISRDARWGRCAESYGEDTLLSCRMTDAVVRGYQGDDLRRPDTMAACVKHFAAYGYAEAGRDYNNVELSRRALLQTFLPPYKAAVDAGAQMVMLSFNTIGGEPCTLSRSLVRDLLRGEWGFDGVTISDYAAILQTTLHAAVNSEEEAALLGMEATLDIDMMDYYYTKYIPRLLQDGRLDRRLFDQAVMRVLRLKNRLGILDDPYFYLQEREPDLTAHYSDVVRAVTEGAVLLENKEALLPLPSGGSVAVIGPFADNRRVAAFWSNLVGPPPFGLSLREALAALLPDSRLTYAPGCPPAEGDASPDEKDGGADSRRSLEAEFLERAVQAAAAADTVVLTLGEYPEQFGESRSRAGLSLPSDQLELLRRISAVNPNIVTVVYCGRPIELREAAEKSKAVLLAWYPDCGGGEGLARLLTGAAVPSGRLPMSFPRTVGQCPLHYDLLPTGHPSKGPGHVFSSRYIDVENTALYPFGFGKSYTEFRYSSISADTDRLSAGGSLTLSVTVENIGGFDGDEVVQLYLHDIAATLVSRPVRELKDFRRVTVPRGERVVVSFEIREEMLRFFDRDFLWKSEPGEFDAFIGPDSQTQNSFRFRLLD